MLADASGRKAGANGKARLVLNYLKYSLRYYGMKKLKRRCIANISLSRKNERFGFEIVTPLLQKLRLLPGCQMTAPAEVVLIAFQLPPLSTLTCCRFAQRWKEPG